MQSSAVLNKLIFEYRLSLFKILSSTEAYSESCQTFQPLTVEAPIPQNGKTHSNNSSANCRQLFECV